MWIMSSNIPISGLNEILISELMPYDFFPLVYSESLVTDRISLQSLNSWFAESGSCLSSSWTSASFSGSYTITSSYADYDSLTPHSTTASYAFESLSSSNVLLSIYAISSSSSLMALTVSYAVSVSFAETSSCSETSSLTYFVTSALQTLESVSSSYAFQSITSSYTVSESMVISSSYVESASYAISSSNSISSSYTENVGLALSSSNAISSANVGYVPLAGNATNTSYASYANTAISASAWTAPNYSPTFISPVVVTSSTYIPHAVIGTFNASPYVPANTQTVLLQGWAVNDNTGDSGDDTNNTPGFIYIRENGGVVWYVLIAYRSGGPANYMAFGGQGVFPINSSNLQFDYQFSEPSDYGGEIDLIGYY